MGSQICQRHSGEMQSSVSLKWDVSFIINKAINYAVKMRQWKKIAENRRTRRKKGVEKCFYLAGLINGAYSCFKEGLIFRWHIMRPKHGFPSSRFLICLKQIDPAFNKFTLQNSHSISHSLLNGSSVQNEYKRVYGSQAALVCQILCKSN